MGNNNNIVLQIFRGLQHAIGKVALSVLFHLWISLAEADASRRQAGRH